MPPSPPPSSFQDVLQGLLEPAIAILHSSAPPLLGREISQIIKADKYHQDAYRPGESELEELLRKGRAYDKLRDKIAKFVDDATLELQKLAELEKEDGDEEDALEEEVVMAGRVEGEKKDASAEHGDLEFEGPKVPLGGQHGAVGFEDLPDYEEEPQEASTGVPRPTLLEQLPPSSPSPYNVPRPPPSPMASTSTAVPPPTEQSDSLKSVPVLQHPFAETTAPVGTASVGSSASGDNRRKSSSRLSLPVRVCEVGGKLVDKKDLKYVMDHKTISLRDKAGKIVFTWDKDTVVKTRIPGPDHPPIVLDLVFFVNSLRVRLRLAFNHSREIWITAPIEKVCERLLEWCNTGRASEFSYASQLLLVLDLESTLPDSEKSLLRLPIGCFGPPVDPASMQPNDEKSVRGRALSLEWDGARKWWMVWKLKLEQRSPALCVLYEGGGDDTPLLWLDSGEIDYVELSEPSTRPYVCTVALTKYDFYDDSRFQKHFLLPEIKTLNFHFSTIMDMENIKEVLENACFPVLAMASSDQQRIRGNFMKAEGILRKLRGRTKSPGSRDRSTSPAFDRQATSPEFGSRGTSPVVALQHSLPPSMQHIRPRESSPSLYDVPRPAGSSRANVWDHYGVAPAESSASSSFPGPSSPLQLEEQPILLSPVVSPTTLSPVPPPSTLRSSLPPTSPMDLGTSSPAASPAPLERPSFTDTPPRPRPQSLSSFPLSSLPISSTNPTALRPATEEDEFSDRHLRVQTSGLAQVWDRDGDVEEEATTPLVADLIPSSNVQNPTPPLVDRDRRASASLASSPLSYQSSPLPLDHVIRDDKLDATHEIPVENLSPQSELESSPPVDESVDGDTLPQNLYSNGVDTPPSGKEDRSKSSSHQRSTLSRTESPEVDYDEEEVEQQLLPQEDELPPRKRRRSQSVDKANAGGKRLQHEWDSLDGSPLPDRSPPRHESTMDLDSPFEEEDRPRVKREYQTPSL